MAEVARRLREYLRDHPDGRYAGDAQPYLDWWDKVSVPGEYRVTLRRGEVDPNVGKYLGGGGPDLGVVVEVGRRRVRSLARHPQHAPADLGLHLPPPDPLEARRPGHGPDHRLRLVRPASSSPPQPQGDPLAIRNLSGTIKLAKGGKTTLVFASDFTMPTLSRPE